MKTIKTTTIIAIVTIIGILFGFAACAWAEEYPRLFIVTDLDYDNDIVIFTDINGEEWEWSGIEDWMIDDFAAAIMEDNGTSVIYDDTIIKVYYEGNVTNWLAWDEDPTPYLLYIC